MEYGLIGEKLSHSYSKLIHEAIASYSYDLKEIPKDNIAAFMEKKEFKAINVTIPYKEVVIPYLSEISDMASQIGAVNAIKNDNGRLIGTNTDYDGMQAALDKAGLVLKGKKVLILGTGGTSKTAYYLAKNNGASDIKKVSRKRCTFLDGEREETCITYEEATKNYADYTFLINTTPVGMFPKSEERPIDLKCFPKLTGVFDVIYNPFQTRLLKQANELNIPCCGGLYMLLMQAVIASEFFTGENITEERIEKEWKSLLSMVQT